MNPKLDKSEIKAFQEILPNDADSRTAMEALERNDGWLDRCGEELLRAKAGPEQQYRGESLWDVTVRVLRQELCGKNDSFRKKLKQYNKNPGSTPLLTGLIVYIVGIASLPFDPAIATIVVLYILKVGINIFCEYAETKDEG